MIEHNGTTCECDCHTADGTPCSIAGGCDLVFEAIHTTTPAPTITQPATPINMHATTIDGTQACIYRCVTNGEHGPGCPCQPTCPEHEGHCTGCAPRPTHARSLLCGSCFYRRLRSPLRRVPALYDWLTSRKGGLKATAYDGDRVQGTKDAPLPFNPDIVEHLALMSLLMNAWTHRAAEQADPGPGPSVWDAAGSAAWLDAHAGWVAEQVWAPTLIGHLRELEHRARVLAPWSRTGHPLPLPCMKCEQVTLVLFGGEDWVTCTNPACDQIIGWFRYERLSREVGRIYKQEGTVA